MDSYEIRPITADEVYPFQRCFEKAFGKDHHEDEAKLERDLFEASRTLAAVHETDGVVGTTLSARRTLGVPGGEVPAAHVTAVSVLGTHRRRGLLRRMMTKQLTELAGTDEPVAILWASEPVIYGRFGYGPATANLSIDADTRELTVPAGESSGTLREVDYAESTDTLAAVYEAARAGRPGVSDRPAALWRFQAADLEHSREGRSGLRTILHQCADGPDGYAVYRIGRHGDATGPAGVVHVEEVVARDRAGYQALWGYLFDIDLTRRLKYDFAAVDEPLRYLVSDPRRLGLRIDDGLWLRVLDVPGALAARRYAADVDVVLDVTDDVVTGNAGRWHLRAGPDGAACVRTDAPADVALPVASLGAAYLGGTPLAALAGADRVREVRPGALAAVSTAFGWHRAPVAIEVF
ncbi:MAG TPA: GNAT family N-acetyltransferase [Actinocatenispora sp.]